MKLKKFTFEILFVIAALFSINYFLLPSDMGFLKINPHPYWLPILLMASYYGVRCGFLTALIFSSLYIALYYFYNIKAIETFWSFKVLGQPSLFIMVGSIVGQISQTLKDAIEEWKKKYTITAKDRDELDKKVKTSLHVQRALENRLVTQLTSLTSIYEFAKKLESFDVQSLYQATLSNFIQHLNIEQASFYRAEHNLLILETTKCREKLHFEPPKEVNKSKGIFNIAITNKRCVSIRELLNEFDFPTLKESPFLCAPLFRKTGVLMGVITVDKIEFEHFTPTTIKSIALVVEWLAAAIDNALYLQETKSKNISDETFGFYNYSYFQQRIKEEFHRAKRYALPLTLILFHIKDYSQLRGHAKLPLLKTLSTTIQKCLRDIDLLSLYNEEDTWAILLPIFPLQEAEKTMKIIENKIREFEFKPYEDEDKIFDFDMLAADYSPKMQHTADLIRAVETKSK